jgi:(p)ppGpp synthase/HD superfamily hydrolase
VAGIFEGDNMTIPAAEALARRLHAGQVDKAGKPCIGHLERTVWYLREMFPDPTDAEIEAAWLHDALEYTTATGLDFMVAGVSRECIDLVRWLTRPVSNFGYLTWIEIICREAPISAIRVKLADNRDNSNPERIAAWSGGEKMLRTRYEPARVMLEEALARRMV